MQGFTLTEMVMVMAVMGIIYALAKPRFNSFIAAARRAEAKTMLAHIRELQRTYRQEEGTYYSGAGDLDKDNKYGRTPQTLPSGKKVSCHNNGLHLRVEDCNALRYWYWLEKGDAHGYVAVAHSRHKDGFNSIFPTCVPSKAYAGGSVMYGGAGGTAVSWPGKTMAGDMFVTTDRQVPEVYIDIIQECN